MCIQVVAYGVTRLFLQYDSNHDAALSLEELTGYIVSDLTLSPHLDPPISPDPRVPIPHLMELQRDEVSRLAGLTPGEKMNLLLEEAKRRLEHFSVIWVTPGLIPLGFQVAEDRLGWDARQSCQIRQGTRANSDLRLTEEYGSDEAFRQWLDKEYKLDVMLYEHAVKLAVWHWREMQK